MLHNLEKFTRDYIVFSTEELFMLANLFQPLAIKEDRFIIKQGELVSNIYFLNNGIIKTFTAFDDKELETKFYFKPIFFSDINAILTNTTSQSTCIATLEATVFFANFEAIKKLAKKSEKHTTFFKMIFKEHYLFGIEKIKIT